jgi:hypothetical protein
MLEVKLQKFCFYSKSFLAKMPDKNAGQHIANGAIKADMSNHKKSRNKK